MDSSLTTKLRRCSDRWYPLKPHPEQLRLIKSKRRYKLVPAGRRSGKTERAKRYLVKRACDGPVGRYFAAAPTFAQVKKIFWEDLKLLSFSPSHKKQPSETELIIYLPNGSTIELVGLDKPERFEGIAWLGGIIDEIASIKPEAWATNIGPALKTYNPTRPNYRPWVWLIGVPEGRNFYYDLCEYAKLDSSVDWDCFTWKSADILPEDEIADAKATLSPMQYRQEYEACHLPDTKVYLFDGGCKKISELVEGDRVIHINANGERESCEVLNGGYTKEKDIMYATLENGDVVKCSPDHNFKIL